MLENYTYSNMKRPVTHWYTKDQPIFENTEDQDSRIDVTRIPGGSDTPPCLKISHNTFETMEKANWEFLRLSLPVTCQTEFIEYAIINSIAYQFYYNFYLTARKKKHDDGKKSDCDNTEFWLKWNTQHQPTLTISCDLVLQ